MTSIEEALFSAVVLIARVFLSAVFLVSGIHGAVWYAKAIEEFKSAAIPLISVTLPLTITLHIIASVCILSGVFVSEAALFLALSTLAVTLWVHRFWRYSGSVRLELSRAGLANLGLIGGLMLLAVSGPGHYVLP